MRPIEGRPGPPRRSTGRASCCPTCPTRSARLIPSPCDGRVLVERDEAVLESLALHGLLTFDQIRRLHFAGVSERPAKRVLARLAGWELVGATSDPVRGHRKVWHATPVGRAAVGLPGGRAESPITGKSRVAHTVAINEFCVALSEEARMRGDQFGYLHWRNEIPHRAPGGLIVPDAVLTYELADGAQALRFLEMDLGTMPVPRVQEKFLRYASYRRSDHWRAHYLAFPKVVVVLAGPYQRERLGHLLRAATRILSGIAAPPVVVLATAEDVATRGPLDPIWNSPEQGELRGLLGYVPGSVRGSPGTDRSRHR